MEKKSEILVRGEERLRSVGEIRKTLFVDGLHFGRIPGVGKPILFKPGAELLMQLYGLVPNFQENIEAVGAGGLDRRIMITASVLDTEGRVVGNGYGFASTLEDRYKWRKACGKEEFESVSDSDRRTIRAGRDTLLQVRQSPDNVMNTVIKMARKRAMVDAVLTIFALSGYFTQDLEDEISPAPLPPSISTDRGARNSPKSSNRAFLNAVNDLQKQYGPDGLREAEKATEVALLGLAHKERSLQIQGYEAVRTFLRHKKDIAPVEENIFKSVS